MTSEWVPHSNNKVIRFQSAEADPPPRQRFHGPIETLGREESVETTPAIILQEKELSKRIRLMAKKLTIKPEERKLAAEIINDLVDQLICFLRNNEKYACFKEVKKLTAGSYYEFVKISHPDEFDIMLTIPLPRIKWTEVEAFSGVLYKLTVSRMPRNDLKMFLLDDCETISPLKMMEELRTLIKQFLKTSYKGCHKNWKVKLQRKAQGSPAVTMLLQDSEGEQDISIDLVLGLEVSQKWPNCTNDGMNIDEWLGKKTKGDLKHKPFYFVPKHPRRRALSEDLKETWRISFSHIEKILMMNHGSAKNCCERGAAHCCRKICLRLMKYLVHVLKEQYPQELSKLYSYCVKTAYFHSMVRRPKDDQWPASKVDECFLNFLDDFIEHVEKSELKHFFVPTYNLFDSKNFAQKNLKFLLKVLKEQKANHILAFAPPEEHQQEALAPQSQHLLVKLAALFVIFLIFVFFVKIFKMFYQ
ncbi:cyclic GMP-AMP synthase-like [Heptranchias perlo]|uniref:cyclic GMP-AMP synthase-like n=1 Tax=Heptranchias perlo TaxID=212740 RepID=UPI003559512E